MKNFSHMTISNRKWMQELRKWKIQREREREALRERERGERKRRIGRGNNRRRRRWEHGGDGDGGGGRWWGIRRRLVFLCDVSFSSSRKLLTWWLYLENDWDENRREIKVVMLKLYQTEPLLVTTMKIEEEEEIEIEGGGRWRRRKKDFSHG